MSNVKTAVKTAITKMPSYPTKAANLKDLMAFIDETCARMDRLKDRIQVTLVMITQHYIANGDYPTSCRLFNQVLDNMAKTGHQAKSAGEWVIAFVGGTIGEIQDANGSKQGFVSLDIEVAKARWNKDLSLPANVRLGAKGTHWVSFLPVTPWAGYDFDTQLDKLLKGAEQAQLKAQETDNADAPTSFNTPLVTAIEALKSMSEADLTAFITATAPANDTVEETPAANVA
jgi:hypothetical protein